MRSMLTPSLVTQNYAAGLAFCTFTVLDLEPDVNDSSHCVALSAEDSRPSEANVAQVSIARCSVSCSAFCCLSNMLFVLPARQKQSLASCMCVGAAQMPPPHCPSSS